MNSQPSSQNKQSSPANSPSISPSNSSGLKAFAIISGMFAIFVIPYIYVLYIYKSGEIPNTGTNERGTFYQPALGIEGQKILGLDGTLWNPGALQNQWAVLNFVEENCDSRCLDNVFNSQQAISTLTRYKGQVDQVVLINKSYKISDDLQTIIKLKDNIHIWRNDALFEQTREQMSISNSLSSHIAIVDPKQQLLLFYTPQHSIQDILRDLKRLLKASVSGYQD